MKKLLSALLILAMFASLTACGENAPEDDGKIDVYVLVEYDGGTATLDEAGRITKAVSRSGIVEEYTYREDGRLSCYTSGWQDTEEPYITREYSYDDTTGIVVENWQQLTTNGYMPALQQFKCQYDQQGRLTQAGTITFQYQEGLKLASMALAGEDRVYKYDAQGLLVEKKRFWQDPDDQRSHVATRYQYDEENRLTSIIAVTAEGEESVFLEFVYEGEFATADLGNGYTAKYQKVSMTPEQVVNCYILHPFNTRAPIYLCNECTDPYWL